MEVENRFIQVLKVESGELLITVQRMGKAIGHDAIARGMNKEVNR